MKHKHYDCIVAWAEGKKIEFCTKDSQTWYDCVGVPTWKEEAEYRVKPISESTVLIVKINKHAQITGVIARGPSGSVTVQSSELANLELVFKNDKLVYAYVLSNGESE